jgi:hypothetical protein
MLEWSVSAPASPALKTLVSTSIDRSYAPSLLSVAAPVGLCHPPALPSSSPPSPSLPSPPGSGVAAVCCTDVLTGSRGLRLLGRLGRPSLAPARLRRPAIRPRNPGLGLAGGGSHPGPPIISGLGVRVHGRGGWGGRASPAGSWPSSRPRSSGRPAATAPPPRSRGGVVAAAAAAAAAAASPRTPPPAPARCASRSSSQITDAVTTRKVESGAPRGSMRARQGALSSASETIQSPPAVKLS